MSLNPIADTKKRTIRLKFQNKSTDELILVKDVDVAADKEEADQDSICTLQVCENEDTQAMQEMQKIVEASHEKIKKQNEEMR